MIRLLAFILLLFAPLSVEAKTTVIRSGEHDDFSRLVIRFADHPVWSFGRHDNGYEFRFEDEDVILDISKVFKLMPKKRIKDVKVPAPGRLKLIVDCDCHGDVFELQNGRIVLDIKDGPGKPGSEFENFFSERAATNLTLEDAKIKQALIEKKFPPMPAEKSAASLPRNASLQFSFGEELSPEKTEKVGADDPDVSSEKEPTSAAKKGKTKPLDIDIGPYFQFERNSQKADLARTALLKSLQRAVAQGVVRIPQAKLAEELPKNPIEDDNETAVAHSPEFGGSNDLDSHILVETVLDRDDHRQDETMNPNSQMCQDVLLASIGSWGNPNTLETPYDDLRSRLFGEFDKLDEAAVEEMVKRQIYLGFGAEAQALMSSLSVKIDEVETLQDMAIIVDGGYPDEDSAIRSKASCHGAFAMWGLLSREQIPDDSVVDKKSVLQAFSALPLHLRKQLGPRLAKRFLDIDDLETATDIRNMASRASSSPVQDLEFLDARIADKAGETKKSLAKLNSVFKANGPDAPYALAELIESQVQTGSPIDVQNARAADALAVEYRGTDIGKRLTIAAIRGLAQTVPVNATLRHIETAKESSGLSDGQIAIVTSEVLLRNAQMSDDEMFLQVVFDHHFDSDISSEARLATAARLLDLGLKDKAKQIAKLYEGTPSNETRIILAKIAISQGRFNDATGILAGLGKAEKDLLSAQIDEKSGDLSKAVRTYSELGRPQDELSAAWRDADWKTVIELGEDVLAHAARLATEREHPLQGPAQSANSIGSQSEQRLLNTSIAAREKLEKLLVYYKSSL